MNEEELERMQAHLREQLATAGMPAQHIQGDILRLVALYIHETRQALGPMGYYNAYRAMEWAEKHIRMDV